MDGTPVDEQLFAGLRKGDRTALARAITLVESGRAEDASPARSLVERCFPHSGASLRIGITGIPGVGKSTLLMWISKPWSKLIMNFLLIFYIMDFYY